MRSLIFFFALLVPATLSTRAAEIDIDSVRSITIQCSLGGLGVSQSYRAVIVRKGPGFVRDDGVTISSSDVAAFVETVNDPMGHFSVERTGIDRIHLQNRLNEAEAYLGESRALAAAREAFEKLFLDENVLAEWFDSGWIRPLETITDYYPEMRVQISAASTSVTVESRSQNRFMLPFRITSPTGERKTWDAALPRSIAALMANRTALPKILSGSDAEMAFGSDVAISPAVIKAILTYGLNPEETRHLATEMGLQTDLQPETSNSDPTYLDGYVWRPGDTRIKYHATTRRSTPESLKALFTKASDRFESFHLNGWLVSALERNPAVTVTLDPDYGVPWRSVMRRGEYAAADYLRNEQDTAVVFRVTGSDRTPTSDWSEWALLDNGDVILLRFSKYSVFPAGHAWFSGVPQTYDKHSMSIVSGVVVHPDGSI